MDHNNHSTQPDLGNGHSCCTHTRTSAHENLQDDGRTSDARKSYSASSSHTTERFRLQEFFIDGSGI